MSYKIDCSIGDIVDRYTILTIKLNKSLDFKYDTKLADQKKDIEIELKDVQADIDENQIEIKHDKDGNIGTSIGRKSFSIDNLTNNLKHLVDFVKKEKPDAIKGEFIKSIYVTSSMGVSLKVNNKSF